MTNARASSITIAFTCVMLNAGELFVISIP